ncbi:MAG: hypothetical protein IT292_07295 [Deltaproteobacteria bacterium]|nr:hypothetical protein [Deltaproteobacteria bacterium]
MAEQLKINAKREICLITIRTRLCELLFINNARLQKEVMAYLAKYQQIYGVVIFGFILMGNHYHLIAMFPNGNRHLFEQVFNRIFANILKRYLNVYRGGPVWARRYRPQALLTAKDVLNYFFYLALNPISSGIVKKLADYNGFNSYYLSLTGEQKKFELIDWRDYKNRKRYNKTLKPKDCLKTYTLVISRLPGHEQDSQEEYRAFLEKERQIRSTEIIASREKDGRGFMGKEKMLKQQAGSFPKHSKIARRYSHYSVALSEDKVLLAQYISNYFEILRRHREASRLYRLGKLDVEFPVGTFRPTISKGIALTLV